MQQFQQQHRRYPKRGSMHVDYGIYIRGEELDYNWNLVPQNLDDNWNLVPQNHFHYET